MYTRSETRLKRNALRTKKNPITFVLSPFQVNFDFGTEIRNPKRVPLYNCTRYAYAESGSADFGSQWAAAIFGHGESDIVAGSVKGEAVGGCDVRRKIVCRTAKRRIHGRTFFFPRLKYTPKQGSMFLLSL